MLDKPDRLRSSSDFRQVYGRGVSAAGDCLVVYIWLSGRPEQRLGISVSRRVGQAATRNLVKRRLREAFRTLADLAPAGADVVIVARTAAAKANYQIMEKEMRNLLKSITSRQKQTARR